MKILRTVVLAALSILIAQGSVRAAVEVNEVMANEPGGNTILEWIELYNNSASVANLTFYELRIGVNRISLTGSLAAGGYMIVCRRLFASGSTPGFESVWGNNSGVWGDDPSENYPEPYEASFNLTNSAGTVELWRAGLLESSLSWSEAGADDVSWERVRPDQAQIVQSRDYSGSTPGFINSLTPVSNDLAIDTVAVSPHNGVTDLTVTVENIGLNQMTNRSLVVYLYNEANPSDESETLATAPIPVVDTGYKTDIDVSISPDGVYRHIGLALSADDRMRNNSKNLTVPAAAFPPVRLSEILADPQSPLSAEWVEFENRRPEAWDLLGWKLCDRNSCHDITVSDLLVPRDSYLVVTSDTVAFGSYYHTVLGVFQPSSWPSLNNDSDVVRLVDSFGYEADRFAYASTYAGNYTWARQFVSDGSGKWGRSVDVGGTPGHRNDVLFAPSSDHTSIEISPRVFSPDGDGQSDKVEISVSAVPASGYTLKIYDRQGRIVRVLFENQQFLRDKYEWDGHSDAGIRLPVGIYIVYLEAVGVESTKATVVIAR